MMQGALDWLCEWCEEWGMEVNRDKTESSWFSTSPNEKCGRMRMAGSAARRLNARTGLYVTRNDARGVPFGCAWQIRPSSSKSSGLSSGVAPCRKATCSEFSRRCEELETETRAKIARLTRSAACGRTFCSDFYRILQKFTDL